MTAIDAVTATALLAGFVRVLWELHQLRGRGQREPIEEHRCLDCNATVTTKRAWLEHRALCERRLT